MDDISLISQTDLAIATTRQSMRKRLPHNQVLLAVEATARLGSFSAAADELNLSQGAVSRQVRRLESQLGQLLFVQKGRCLTTTVQGTILVSRVREGLSVLCDAVDSLMLNNHLNKYTISTFPAAAYFWLSPRLSRIKSCADGFALVINPNASMANLAQEGVDVAIRYGNGGDNGVGVCVERLCGEHIFPVARPDFVKKYNASIDNLITLPKISHPFCSWANWFQVAGFGAIKETPSYITEDSALAIQFALDGRGVALGRSLLVADLLSSGHLVRIGDIKVQDPNSYWLVYPHQSSESPVTKGIRDSIVSEIHGTDLKFMRDAF